MLLPYRTDPASLNAIEAAYIKLKTAKRLVVPAQVAREFASNRPTLLRELYEQMNARYIAIKSAADYPLRGELAQYKELKTIETTLRTKVEESAKPLVQSCKRCGNGIGTIR